MKKEELDSLKTALLKAIVGAFDVIENEEPAAPKKRRRPPKREVQELLEKTIEGGETEEKIEDILAFEAPMPSPEKKKNDYIATAKRVATGVEIRNVGGLQEIQTKNRQIKFIDDRSVGDHVTSDKYPERSERRPPAQMGKFTCDVCHKSFEGSYKEFPQALYTTRDTAMGVVDKPLLKCNECSTKPVSNYY